MTEFKVTGEIFNLPSVDPDVVAVRDLIESRKTSVREQVLAIINDPSNSNYIYDAALHAALTDPAVLFDSIFTTHLVESDYSLTPVVIPDYVAQTESTISISSTVTLLVPMDPASINYNAVAVKTTNKITGTNFSVMSADEKAVVVAAYKEAYIATIAANSGISRTVLDGATTEVEIFDDGEGGVQINFKVSAIPGASVAVLDQVKDSIVAVNESGALATAVTNEIPARAAAAGVVLVETDLSGIPATSAVFIALSKITVGGLEVSIPSIGSLQHKSLVDMSPAEQYIVKTAYTNVYIETAASSGVILTADNLLVTLVSGSIKVIIKVSNIELSNTTFASQIEGFFASTTNDPVSAQAIADESITILQAILSRTANVPNAITTEIQNEQSPLYISLNTYFSSPEFIAALESSTVENVTMIISADGEATSFTISQGGTDGIGKGIKILPHMDASMFTDGRKRDAIKKGRFNKSVGDNERVSIAYQVRRSALQRVRGAGRRQDY